MASPYFGADGGIWFLHIETRARSFRFALALCKNRPCKTPHCGLLRRASNPLIKVKYGQRMGDLVAHDESHMPLTPRHISLRSQPAAGKATLLPFQFAASNPLIKPKHREAGRPPCVLVRMGGFEPPSFRRRILSPLCMPFHHIRRFPSAIISVFLLFVKKQLIHLFGS